MTSEDAALHELAAAILDGATVDWASAESSAAGESLQQIIRDLRVIAAIAELHGTTTRDERPAASQQPPPASGLPWMWGPLRVLEPVGHGAYGEVYRAWDTRLDREVALKLLPARADADPRATSIIAEGRLLARVRHSNVVTIYGAERSDDRIGLWMEFIRGRTLEELLQEGHAFGAGEAIDIGIQLCRAVSAVHGAGLLHQDIKTHNVMLTTDGRVVLMDFGAGRELKDDSGAGLAGTPLYLAPEVLFGEAATVASDIYSVGVLLYHLLTGSYPLSGRSLHDLRIAHQRSERRDLITLSPDISPALAGVIERALDPRPEGRYQRAGDLEADLAALKARRRAVWPAYAGAVMVAVVVAALGVGVLGGQLESFQTPGALLSHAAGWLAAGATKVGPPDPPAIAVVPFQNPGSEPRSDYFADGLTDEIIRTLGTIEGLHVRSRSSSFAFKDAPRNLRDVGEQLGVNHVIEVAVLRADDRVRINAQLFQVEGEVSLWAKRFDRPLEDVFAVQDEISRAIVNQLRLTLGRGQRRYDTNIKAYDLYLRGRDLIRRGGAPSLERAADLFREALASDPAFAPAQAGLANAYALLAAPLSSSQPYAAVHPGLRQTALKALELDPLLADAHLAMGWMYSHEHDWTNAERAFREAIELNPSLSETYTSYAISTLQPLGKLEEALRLLQAALVKDPLSLDVQREIGSVQLQAGRYDDAIDTFQRMLAADPAFPFVEVHLGRALVLAGRASEALVVLEGLDGRYLGRFRAPGARRPPWLGPAYVAAGRRDEAERLAAEAAHPPSALAIIAAALDDHQRAFEALERVAAVQPHHLPRLLALPEMARLRGEPRFQALRGRFGLPDR